VKAVIVSVWILIGFYFGAAACMGIWVTENTSVHRPARGADTGPSYEYDGIPFKNEASLKDYLTEQTASTWFPWILGVPQIVNPFLAVVAWGLVGGGARNLRKWLMDPAQLPYRVVLLDPLYSAIIALMLYSVFLLLPSAVLAVNSKIRTWPVIPFSLLGGFFSEEAHAWIQYQVKKIFSKKEEERTR
jgi:hypothetical protein